MKFSALRRVTSAAVLLAVAAAVTGCAHQGLFAKLPPDANFGAPPSNAEEQVKRHFEGTLKDPESARFRFSPLERAYGNEGLAYGGGIRWVGYLMPVEVNAKNSFGGYVGFTPYLVLFNENGSSIRTVLPGSQHPLIHIVR